MELANFLDTKCPGWQRRSLTTINDRLSNIGSITIRFAHRQREIVGTLVMESFNSTNAFFWFQEIRRWCTVSQYYFIQYGIELVQPETNLFRILPSFSLEEDEVSSDNLFPMELIRLDSNFYPLSFYS
ncbi:hypothetical protein CRE_27733 [Caenorhabditis remanei]|uniref:Uncharacterized protein n=1 Tax=Caenorhabditis remanei TaxID=31234 RepID=E3MXN3_CAERE|nr:hypothetical protein CRE_27733 [Caenorhabditis remanei]